MFHTSEKPKVAIKYTSRPNSSQSDFLASWENTDLGRFIINRVRNEYVDFWDTIHRWRQTLLSMLLWQDLHAARRGNPLFWRLCWEHWSWDNILHSKVSAWRPALWMLITLIFSNVNKRSFFVLSLFPWRAHLKITTLKQKAWITQCSCVLVMVSVLVAALLSGRRHRGPCVCSYQSSLIQAPGLHVPLTKRECYWWHCPRLLS